MEQWNCRKDIQEVILMRVGFGPSGASFVKDNEALKRAGQVLRNIFFAESSN
jgi:hypothetical protein